MSFMSCISKKSGPWKWFMELVILSCGGGSVMSQICFSLIGKWAFNKAKEILTIYTLKLFFFSGGLEYV